MRAHPTPAEAALWPELRALKVHGVKWRRQAIILGFIVDFFCPRLKLVIEVDGSAHDGREAYDLERTEALERRAGVKVLRFLNDEVLADPAAVALLASGLKKCL